MIWLQAAHHGVHRRSAATPLLAILFLTILISFSSPAY
jgi:hypothetical protein